MPVLEAEHTLPCSALLMFLEWEYVKGLGFMTVSKAFAVPRATWQSGIWEGQEADVLGPKCSSFSQNIPLYLVQCSFDQYPN